MTETDSIHLNPPLNITTPSYCSVVKGSDHDSLLSLYDDDEFSKVICHHSAQSLVQRFIHSLDVGSAEEKEQTDAGIVEGETANKVQNRDYDPDGNNATVGLAAFAAFLQINVTGPASDHGARVERWLAKAYGGDPRSLRRACLRSLEVDGVAPYPHVPFIELYCLAQFSLCSDTRPTREGSLRRLRILAWHYRLLTPPSLATGSTLARSMQWSDVPSLVREILNATSAIRQLTMEKDTKGADDADAFALLELANVHILLGRDADARRDLDDATTRSGLISALSGALGRRTKFQESDISQLVVLARSRSSQEHPTDTGSHPTALPLNDDTLLENVAFASDFTPVSLHPALTGMRPDDQPQLRPVDHAIILAEATLRDVSAPSHDSLSAEQVLPYASRVLADPSVNWQIFTHALLVRARVEAHRDRTSDRALLQLQALVDQVVAETTEIAKPDEMASPQVSAARHPTSFFSAPRNRLETAPVSVRLQFVHAIAFPPRWHLEAELAQAYARAGSLVSALDIFRRLHLWAEVALCLAAADRDNRARALLRWRLFDRATLSPAPLAPDASHVSSISLLCHDSESRDPVDDPTALSPGDFSGLLRCPAPADAPRLLCILADLEADPTLYTTAWEVSGSRYARAQRSLAEHYVRRRDWAAARAAYELAVPTNRQSDVLWNSLGEVCLHQEDFAAAATAFSRAVSAAGSGSAEDPTAWSNLGSALWSMYRDDPEQPQSDLLGRAMAAFKRGAALAPSNWRIWDNVLTVASRHVPPAVPDMVHAIRHIFRLRPTEDAADASVLHVLIAHTLLNREQTDSTATTTTTVKAVVDLLERHLVPLITRRADLWALIGRARAARADWPGAIDAAERAWRTELAGGVDADPDTWLIDPDKWAIVARRTSYLVSVYEAAATGPSWRAKARAAIRSVLGRAATAWEGDETWTKLDALAVRLDKDTRLTPHA